MLYKNGRTGIIKFEQCDVIKDVSFFGAESLNIAGVYWVMEQTV